MDVINYDHAMSIYKDIKNGNDSITKDFGQLYFAISVLGDEVIRLQRDIANENTALIRKIKSS